MADRPGVKSPTRECLTVYECPKCHARAQEPFPRDSDCKCEPDYSTSPVATRYVPEDRVAELEKALERIEELIGPTVPGKVPPEVTIEVYETAKAARSALSPGREDGDR